VGGAAVNGVVDGVTGAAKGVRRGLKNRKYSTPAAALTLGALGVTGLIEWPLLVAVGGGALLLRRLNQPSNSATASIAAAAEEAHAEAEKVDGAAQKIASPTKSASRRTTGSEPKPPGRTRAGR
jgi:hypothetical protein